MEAALDHPPPPSHPSRACDNARLDNKPPICARPTTRRGQRGGGRVRAAYLGRRVTTWAMCMARSPPQVGGWSAPGARLALRPLRVALALHPRRSARTGLMPVPCDLRSLRTSSSSGWQRQPPTMAATVMPRQAEPRPCPVVPRRSAHHASPDAAALLPAARSAALLWSGGAPECAACSRAPVLQSARAPERPCSRLHGRVSVVMGAASKTATPLAAHRVVSAAPTIRPQRT